MSSRIRFGVHMASASLCQNGERETSNSWAVILPRSSFRIQRFSAKALHDFLPAPLATQDQLNRFAHRAAASAGLRDVVHITEQVFTGVADRHSETTVRQQRQVR